MPEVRISAWLCSSWPFYTGGIAARRADFSVKEKDEASPAQVRRDSSNAFILRFVGGEGFCVLGYSPCASIAGQKFCFWVARSRKPGNSPAPPALVSQC